MLSPLGTTARKQTDRLICSGRFCVRSLPVPVGIQKNKWASPSSLTPSYGLLKYSNCKDTDPETEQRKYMCVPTEMGPTVLGLATNSQQKRLPRLH